MKKHRIALVLISCLMALLIAACGSDTSSDNANPISDTPTASASPAVSSTPTATPNPLQVTDLAVSVNPSSFSSVNCGSTTSITFSASIELANGTGGQLPFTWNVNNTQRTGSVTFVPGETSTTVSYTLSKVTAQVGTAPSGSITVGKPGSSLSSPMVSPQGTCRLPGPFQVVGIALSAYPSSLSGIACGSTITVTYTATIYIGADSDAGTVQLTWTVGNAQLATSVVFAPTQTVKAITYTEASGRVFRTSVFPHAASIASVSPNAVYSATVRPIGTCF